MMALPQRAGRVGGPQIRGALATSTEDELSMCQSDRYGVSAR